MRVTTEMRIATNPKAGISYYYLGQHIENTLSPAETASRSTQPTEKDRKTLEAYGTAIALDQGLVPAYLGRANIHWYLKNSTLAVSDYTKAIAIQHGDGKIYNRRAQLYMELGKYGLAEEDFGKAIELHPTWLRSIAFLSAAWRCGPEGW
jgi:tetratricopeptide (TPR) repeat protein